MPYRKLMKNSSFAATKELKAWAELWPNDCGIWRARQNRQDICIQALATNATPKHVNFFASLC
jgi:hypothetical protein